MGKIKVVGINGDIDIDTDELVSLESRLNTTIVTIQKEGKIEKHIAYLKLGTIHSILLEKFNLHYSKRKSLKPDGLLLIYKKDTTSDSSETNRGATNKRDDDIFPAK